MQNQQIKEEDEGGLGQRRWVRVVKVRMEVGYGG